MFLILLVEDSCAEFKFITRYGVVGFVRWICFTNTVVGSVKFKPEYSVVTVYV